MPDIDFVPQSLFEDRFFAIVDQSPFSIQIMSPDGFTVRVNKAWEKLWGATLEQLKGYNMLEDEQLERRGVMKYIKRAFAGEFAEIPPIRYDPNETIPDLSSHAEPVRWTRAVIYPIKDAAGEVQEVVLVHEDITNQMSAEEKLKDSESRYRLLFETSLDGIMIVDGNGKYIDVNESLCRILKTPREKLMGSHFSEHMLPERVEDARKAFISLQEKGFFTGDFPMRAGDGTIVELTWSSRANFMPGLHVCVARDLSERKRIEKEKQELAFQVEKQRQRLQELVSSVPGIVWEAWGKPDAATQRIDFVSDYVEKMVGYGIEEWLSTPNFWLSIVHPDDKEAAARKAAENFASRDTGTSRFRWIAKDGRVIWVESQSVAIFDETGNPIGMRGVTMDITERKRKEDNERFLAEASTTLASSLDYETTLAAVTNLAVPHFADWCAVDIAKEDGTLQRLAVAHVDPAKVVWAQEIYDRYPPTPDDPQGLYNVYRTGKSEFYPDIPDEMLVQGARDAEHLEILRRVGFRSVMLVPLKTREKVLGVLTFVNSESECCHTPEDLALAEDLANRAALAVDNARLYQAEHESRMAAERNSNFLKRLQSVSESLSKVISPSEVAESVIEQAIISLGAHAGTVVLLNGTTRELEMVGAVNFPEAVLEKWQRFSIDQNVPIAEAVRSGNPVIIESFDDVLDRFPLLGSLSSVTGSRGLAAFPLIIEGRILGALGLSFPSPQYFSDDDRAFMSALAQQCAQAIERARRYEREKNLRREAEAANRMKDEFLATLSHELRTPLNSILGWSQMLQNGSLDETAKERALVTIERNARVQNQLIEDVLDISRIITGKLGLVIRPVDLRDVIAAAAESLRPAMEAKGMRLKHFIDAQTGFIQGDAGRLQQVIWNLLSNAVKFTPEGGDIQIGLRGAGTSVEIVVTDSGIGIEEDFLPFVFDRFRQLDGSTTRRHGGLGLGLSIVRQLVEMHGGTVRAENNRTGKGASFTVNLPVLAEEKQPAGVNGASALKPQPDKVLDGSEKLAGLRILIVEDEDDSCELLSFVLSNCGATVTAVRSASEAYDLFRRQRFDLVISDIGMPEEDGYSLIKKIRALPVEQGGAVHAVALTAYARNEDRIKALEAGFQIHISKPIEPFGFINEVAKLAERI